MDILVVLFWSLVGSVVSLIGGIALVGASTVRKNISKYALPFGAGALLATAFLGLLPEALEGGDVHEIVLYALGGFLVFFALERFISWFHHHHHDEVHGSRNKTHTWLVIIGDTLHNAIDGIALGAAFLVNPAAGITTALAVAAHEVPQEIGDFGILLAKGMKPRKVILVNLLSALATVVTALATFMLGGLVGIDPAPLLAVAAGFFIYIAASDIIPDIHERPRDEANIQTLLLFLGVIILGAVAMLTPHDHAHAPVDEHTESVEHDVPTHEDHDHHGEHEHQH